MCWTVQYLCEYLSQILAYIGHKSLQKFDRYTEKCFQTKRISVDYWEISVFIGYQEVLKWDLWPKTSAFHKCKSGIKAIHYHNLLLLIFLYIADICRNFVLSHQFTKTNIWWETSIYIFPAPIQRFIKEAWIVVTRLCPDVFHNTINM